MQTTGIFRTHRVEIPVTSTNRPVVLYPFGDSHFGAPLHATDAFDSWLATVKRDKGAWFLGMGDLVELTSTSERSMLGAMGLHDSTREMLDDMYGALVRNFAKKLDFMKGRVIGLLEGNHYFEHMDGTTSTQRLCQALGCPYLGVSAFVRLILNYHGCQTPVDIWAHHGRGAARLIGGSLNRVQQMGEAAQADIYLMGHDHKKSVGMTSKLVLSHDMRLCERKQVYCRTGSFLKGYEDGKSSYVADAAYAPSDLGTVRIEIAIKRPGKFEGPRHLVADIRAAI